MLFAAYFPYFLIPLILLVRMCADEHPFGGDGTLKPKRKAAIKKGE